MTVYAKFRTDGLKFEDLNPSEAEAFSLFKNETSEVLEFKNAGASNPLGGGATDNLLVKAVISSQAIAINIPVTKLSNGKIAPVDASIPGREKIYGTTKTSFAGDDSVGDILLIGPNAAGVLSGAGFNTGDEIYVSDIPGLFTNNPASLAETSPIVFAGFADCPESTASPTATDLIFAVNKVAEPPT